MEEEEPIVVEPNVSIFDDKEFETVDECVAHMQTNFGFFIPEKEYLVDLPGFLVYLGEKVKIGGICLYCQKQFRPGRPLQNHMQSKSHCKIAYEEGVDLDEFEDFYDFSSSYGEGNGTRGGAGEDGDEELDDDDCLEIADTGELLLADGRRLGHRAFRRYYKQRYTPPDTRVAITAQRREDLVRAAALNVGGFRHLTIVGHVSELKNMSDHEVMNLMVRHHKEMRKMQMIEQRATRKQDYRANRMAFQSVKDKLRSSVNTTAKIRDYHGMLM
ncbi:Znf622 [Symbiodinium microadriaticum]|nr:Znf622 [Symbiodinium microadriaticum]